MIDTEITSAAATRKILIVEDDTQIQRVLREALQDAEYRVWVAGSGAEGERLVGEVRPDLVLLDLVLPDVDGLVFCATLRRRWHMPIILLSGTQRQRDRVLGLTLGADDFVPKPFDLNELLARIDAMLRRAAMSGSLASEQPRATSDAQTFGSFSIDRARRLASVASRALELTPTEFQILSLMSTRPGEVFTRQELASALWDRVDVSKSRAIDVHIRRLRQKLQVPEAPVIETVWGYGYKLEVAR